jgi:hypothetical protein
MEGAQMQAGTEARQTQDSDWMTKVVALLSRRHATPADEESHGFWMPQSGSPDRSIAALRSLTLSVAVEDYRPGYPRFSALLGSDATFQVGRRFSMVRMRLQLLKQDEVSRLEEQLNAIDRCEKRELFLGNCRRDANQDRLAIIPRLEKALAEYGKP